MPAAGADEEGAASSSSKLASPASLASAPALSAPSLGEASSLVTSMGDASSELADAEDGAVSFDADRSKVNGSFT